MVKMYDSPEELQSKIDEYFEKGVRKRKVKIGKGKSQQIIEVSRPTVTGLCHYLGFSSRQSFYDYAKNKEFTHVINRAKLFFEMIYEEMLHDGGGMAGPIFVLKNMGWTDQQHINMKSFNVIKDMSEKELDDEIKRLQG